MKYVEYVEKVLIGVGLATVFLVAWYWLVGGSDVWQYYYNINNVNSFFAAVVFAVVFAAVVFAAVVAAAAVAAAAAVVAAAAAVAAAANLNFGLTVIVFIIFLIFGLIEVYIVNQIKNKKFDKSYWLTYGVLIILFVVGIYYTPLIIDVKSYTKLEAVEKIAAELTVKKNQISIPVESQLAGYELAKYLYIESADMDSAGRSLLFAMTEVGVLGRSNKDTSYYNLVFPKDSSAVALWIRSYNKKKKIFIF